jgi:hypothetical protein
MDTTTVRDLLVLDSDEADAAGVFFMEQATEAAVDFLSIASSAFVISSRNETMSVGIGGVGGGNFNSSSGSFDSNSVVTNVSSVRHLNPSVQVPYTIHSPSSKLIGRLLYPILYIGSSLSHKTYLDVVSCIQATQAAQRPFF